MTSRRLFFALWPTADLQQQMFQQAKPVIPRGARPVRQQNLHITLAFLGEQPAERLAALQALAAQLDFEPFELRLDHFAGFRRSQVMFLEPAETPEAATVLHRRLNNDLQAAGFPVEQRRWVPHVTVARKVRGRFRRLQLHEPVVWPVQGFALIESVLMPEGAQYRILETWEASPGSALAP